MATEPERTQQHQERLKGVGLAVGDGGNPRHDATSSRRASSAARAIAQPTSASLLLARHRRSLLVEVNFAPVRSTEDRTDWFRPSSQAKTARRTDLCPLSGARGTELLPSLLKEPLALRRRLDG